MQAEAYLGLGSNLGDRRRRLREALEAIGALASDLRVSSLYETQPQGFSGQPAFLNAVCRVWTRLGPFELLDALRSHSGGGRSARVRQRPQGRRRRPAVVRGLGNRPAPSRGPASQDVRQGVRTGAAGRDSPWPSPPGPEADRRRPAPQPSSQGKRTDGREARPYSLSEGGSRLGTESSIGYVSSQAPHRSEP